MWEGEIFNCMLSFKQNIKRILQMIPDPELGISLWDLGLIYDISADNETGNVRVLMTLTSMGCPLFSVMEEPIKKKIGKLPGVKHVTVDLTFEPPWTIDRMSKSAREKLGM